MTVRPRFGAATRAAIYDALALEPHTENAELQAIRVRQEMERRGCAIEGTAWNLPDGRTVGSLWEAAAAILEAEARDAGA